MFLPTNLILTFSEVYTYFTILFYLYTDQRAPPPLQNNNNKLLYNI